MPPTLADPEIAEIREALEDETSAFSAFRKGDPDTGPWVLTLISQQEPDMRLLTAVTKGESWELEKLPDIDWLAHSYKQFPAFSVGDFFIYGSHHDGDVPEDKIPLQIDAATAFGSGEHGTTAGCLHALQDLKSSGFNPSNVLDMGTGSGILALAAYRLWAAPTLGVDNDDEATRVSIRHRDVNGIKNVDFETGDGFAANGVKTTGPFDLVIANILAGPLKDMAGDLKTATAKDGIVVLSGILITQAEDVLGVYERLGFTLQKRYEINKWSTLVLHL